MRMIENAFFSFNCYNLWPGKASMSETAKYSSWVWHKGGGGRLSKTGANRPVRNLHIFQKLSHFVRDGHILSLVVFQCVLRWGMSTLVWNLTDWSGLESLTSRFLFQFLFFWTLSLVIYHQQLGFRYQYNLMDAGLMLNLSPNVTHQEGVDCANLE